MKIRITGLPVEVSETVRVLTETRVLDITEISDPYPNRGNSRLVRVYIDARMPDDGEATR